jgi:SAM-dependent methyltransferase
VLDLPRPFVIRERHHRIHNPFDDTKLAVLGRAVRLQPGQSMLDLASGSGEMLCTWSRDHAITGVGVDISTDFVEAARARASELGVDERVSFVHADASGYVSSTPVDIAACIGATWIGDGVDGTLALLERSLRPGGLLLVGEPFWLQEPPDQATVEGNHARSRDDFDDLPALISRFGRLGFDVIEMVLADGDSWDRYEAPKWFNVREWLDANPDDELAGAMRAELDTAALNYVRYRRPYLGWGVFALRRRA